jgi:hypothetical protein
MHRVSEETPSVNHGQARVRTPANKPSNVDYFEDRHPSSEFFPGKK